MESIMTNEPDYTLTIIEKDGGFIVCEGGEQISKPFEDKTKAEWWAGHRQRWHQPTCCVCGSAVSKPDDPWKAYSVSCSMGADWMHKSCMDQGGFED
jgi:hypothetical protein